MIQKIMNIYHDGLFQKVVVADFLFRCHFEGIKTTKFNYVIQFIELTLQEAGGADSARPEEKLRFWYNLVIQLTQKNLTFPKYL